MWRGLSILSILSKGRSHSIWWRWWRYLLAIVAEAPCSGLGSIFEMGKYTLSRESMHVPSCVVSHALAYSMLAVSVTAFCRVPAPQTPLFRLLFCPHDGIDPLCLFCDILHPKVRIAMPIESYTSLSQDIIFSPSMVKKTTIDPK
jgi:hypothetical protein